MNLSDITTKPWILALFKRDDGERFLLGDGYYDFKDSLQHFQPNSMSNDIVELQGADGQLLAGQVRRSGTQSFDGYIGDGTTNRKIVEQRRKAFLMFFRKKHYYTVVYIFCDGTAIKRERGYLVDAPSVPEIRQKSPEYHVALNFENVNYYEYAENAQGEEIYSNVREIVVSNIISGGLVWDNLGAVSEALQWGAYTTESGSFITLNDVIQNAPMSLTQIKGNAEQNGTPTPDAPVPVDVVTGAQTVGVTGKNLFDGVLESGLINGSTGLDMPNASFMRSKNYTPVQENTVYVLSSPTYTSTTWYIYEYKSDKTYNMTTNKTSASGVFTTNLGTSFVRFRLTQDQTDTNAKIQLELGNSPSQFEPYQAQEFEVNLGKNLIPYPFTSADGNYNDVIFATNSDGQITGSGTSSAGLNFDLARHLVIQQSGQYTLSINGTHNNINLRVYDNSASSALGYISQTQSSLTLSLTAGQDIRIYFNQGSSGVSVDIDATVQFERGSQATSFAPYFTPIELAKIGTYQDKIYFDSDTSKWYLHKEVGKVVLESSDVGIYIYGSYTNIDYASLTKPADSFMYRNYDSPVGKTISSCAIPSEVSGGFDKATYVGKLLSQPSLNKFWIGFAKGTVLTDMQNALDGQNVYYALATPTDTEITDSTLIEQLEHIYQLYGGLNNISIVGAGNGSIEIRYATVLNPGGGFVWEDGGTGGLTTITIDAVDLTLPVWTITGPATNPTLSNITTGQTMSWLGTVPSGQTLIIDMNEQTATMAGANVYAFLSGNWVGLAPGTNRISYSVTGTDEASTLSWNNIVG